MILGLPESLRQKNGAAGIPGKILGGVDQLVPRFVKTIWGVGYTVE